VLGTVPIRGTPGRALACRDAWEHGFCELEGLSRSAPRPGIIASIQRRRTELSTSGPIRIILQANSSGDARLSAPPVAYRNGDFRDEPGPSHPCPGCTG
jgi:hypothetical protein